MENYTKNNIKTEFENIVSKYTGPTNSLGMYKQSIIKKNNTYGIVYNSNYTLDEYNSSISFNDCFDHSKITLTNDEIEIATSTGFKCFETYEELEEVTVKVKTDYEVIDSNADKIEKDVYTWNITRENADNVQLNIRVNSENRIKNSNDNKLQTIIFFVGILIIIALILLIIKVRGQRKNKI